MRRGWTDDGEWMFLEIHVDELADMAPDLDDEQLHDIGWYLMEHWTNTMQQDIDDLKDGA